jgi:UDP-N-acetylmuramate--alanine ligase
MSAIAQYLAGAGYNVSGSDRYFKPGEYNETKEKLEAEGIAMFFAGWLWYYRKQQN